MSSQNEILSKAIDIKDELITIYRQLHMNPELSFEEYRTSEFIAGYLEKLGLEVRTGIGKTGVVATLKGMKPGNTIALRADIDALPIQEENSSEYKSKAEGKMHACGHDAHMAILLGAAKLLTENRDKLKGIVKFIFQPAEEIVSGAELMIKEGVLENPRVDEALALHVFPDTRSGHVKIKSGPAMASVDDFEITITGCGGHGSNPQGAVDPIMIGAQIINTLYTVLGRKTRFQDPAVVSVCKFHAGTKSNIIPDKAYMEGTIRCFSEEAKAFVCGQIESVVGGICGINGANFDIKLIKGVPVLINNHELVNKFIKVSEDILQEDQLEVINKPYMVSEDFSLFAQKIPSVMFFLGIRNDEKECIYPLHNPKFTMDEDALCTGTALFVNYCLNNC